MHLIHSNRTTKYRNIMSLILSIALIICIVSGDIVNAYSTENDAVMDEITSISLGEYTVVYAQDEAVYKHGQTRYEELSENFDLDKYSSSYVYNKMSDKEKALCDQVNDVLTLYLKSYKNAIYSYKTGGVTSYYSDPVNIGDMNSTAAIKAVICYLAQHPEFYFIGEKFICEEDGDLYIQIKDAFVNGASRMSYSEVFFAKADSFIKDATAKEITDPVELELLIHDKICNLVNYNTSDMDHSAAGALIDGNAICMGYAKLFCMIANACGIETLVAISKTHAWNIVKIEGCWYNTDTSWDDVLGMVAYFNLSDAQMKFIDISDSFYLEDYIAVYLPKTDYEYVAEGIKSGIVKIEKLDKEGITASASFELGKTDSKNVEYAWYASEDGGESYVCISDWSTVNLLSWKPSHFGNFSLMCKVREKTNTGNYADAYTEFEYHPYITGVCQMPYGMISPGQSGYLLGIEVLPEMGVDSVEMLIFDCSSLQWVYTTGKCGIVDNCLWTVWQPQYGYYWTLFRAYDKDGNMIDEVCYGFAAI